MDVASDTGNDNRSLADYVSFTWQAGRRRTIKSAPAHGRPDELLGWAAGEGNNLLQWSWCRFWSSSGVFFSICLFLARHFETGLKPCLLCILGTAVAGRIRSFVFPLFLSVFLPWTMRWK